jgi:acyl carrier protein
MQERASITEVESVVRRLLSQASNFTVERLDPEQQLRALGIDSLGCHAMSVVLEAELGIDLNPEELGRVLAQGRSSDLVDLVMRLGPAAQEGI